MKTDNIIFLFYRKETTFDNPTYDITSFTPTQYRSHGPEDSQSPPDDISITTPATVPSANPSAMPPIYAIVNKKASQEQREQTGSVDNENVTGGYSVLEDEGEDVVYQVLGGPGETTYEGVAPKAADD